ncbi:saccharopine dehydrogenase NADP-binding domain-containing protein, partial [bacterium]|nr:saccharopine dehydrogenase NADP-binding domain-containing protein [bacterium]
MKILVLGAGLMGRAVVFDMLRNPKLEGLVVADHDPKQLKETEALIDDPNELRIKYKKLDIDDEKEVGKLMQDCDTVVSAVTYKYNFKLAKLAITNGCNFCDLG